MWIVLIYEKAVHTVIIISLIIISLFDFFSIFQSKSGSPLAGLLATNTAVAISVFNEILSEVYVTSGKIQGALLDTFEYLKRLRTSGLNASHWEGS